MDTGKERMEGKAVPLLTAAAVLKRPWSAGLVVATAAEENPPRPIFSDLAMSFALLSTNFDNPIVAFEIPEEDDGIPIRTLSCSSTNDLDSLLASFFFDFLL